ncbi:ABC transporter substrate-binding protein [Thermopolyspora sp. NPDC052614]|uniref:ABC transporter substrate-binding protein n=1 Tax=Thermopolyspora sp. NPDC052614 TaxID=3155682 RepID=UPI00343A21BA
MADLRSVIATFIRRPWFWRRDRQLPLLLVTGPDAAVVAEEAIAPFAKHLPSTTVREGDHASVAALVAALAGSRGQLGKPVDGSFLPAPRFPLAQFVLWARKQRDEPPDSGNWPPDPQSHEGFQVFKTRLKEWRRKRPTSGGTWRLVVDFFLGRAAVTWVPLGTLVVWLAAGPSDLVGVLPWLLGILVATIGICAQGLGSLRGSFFYGWFKRQQFTRRGYWERLATYALRLANATDDDSDRLLVHALCEDLRQAYKKWPIPWPSWGRGLYCLLHIEIDDVQSVNARFLRLLEDTCETTGLVLPMLVIATVPDELAGPRLSAAPAELGALTENVRKWRRARLRHRTSLRLVVRSNGHHPSPAPPYRLRPWRHQARAIGYWGVVLLGLPGLIIWLALSTINGRAASCGGLTHVERLGGECIGVINATRDVPRDLFKAEIYAIMQKIDATNRAVDRAGEYVSLALFGEYSVETSWPDERYASALSELTAAEEFQRAVMRAPRVKILIVNAGDNYRQGKRAAELVTKLAEEDTHLMGVVGLARSVAGVEQAVSQFDAAKIPVVSTTATADDLGMVNGRPSPYYFHLSPTNFRQATLAARFARKTLPTTAERASAVIVQDGMDEDTYTNNLAADFASALQKEKFTVGSPIAYGDSQDQMTPAVAKACARKPHVFMYAGRASDFLDFLRAIEGSGPCGDRLPARVIAGDDVSRVVAAHSGEITNMRRVMVYYASLANREIWKGNEDNAFHATEFISRLIKGAHKTAVDDTLILTYDALDVIYRAANKAHRPGGRLPSSGDVLFRLSRTFGESAWNGSSGVIDFGWGERHDPVNKAIAIMRVESDASSVEVRCGRLHPSESLPTDEPCVDLPDIPKNVP